MSCPSAPLNAGFPSCSVRVSSGPKRTEVLRTERSGKLPSQLCRRTRQGGFGKGAQAVLHKKVHQLRFRGPVLPKFPSRLASPASIVAAMKRVAGLPPKSRASFAKGRCVRGTYAPSDQAKEITKSCSFTKPSRVLARFSVAEGPDTNYLLLRGFSFRLGSDGERSEILTQSAPVHFARTLDQMLAFLRARIPGPDGKPDMEKVEDILSCQSRDAASGKLHRRASAARKLCLLDLLGRARVSRDEFKRRDTVHQVQGHASRRTGDAAGPRPRQNPPSCCTTSSPGSQLAI